MNDDVTHDHHHHMHTTLFLNLHILLGAYLRKTLVSNCFNHKYYSVFHSLFPTDRHSYSQSDYLLNPLMNPSTVT